MNFGFYVKGDHSNIGYDLTHFRLNVSKFKKLFPKRESLWLSSVRNVHDQVNSLIRFLKLQNYYQPANFKETLQLFKMGKREKKIWPFTNGGISWILYECVDIKDFENFKLCANNISSEFDIVIPTNRIDEGLIMLHKLSCLPLVDFAYTKKKVSSGDFTMSEQNMSIMLTYHEKAIWFYNYSSAIFEQKFNKFQEQHCNSYNCRNEIEELKKENRKLEEACEIHRSDFDQFAGIQMNWDKLRQNATLALRCLSF